MYKNNSCVLQHTYLPDSDVCIRIFNGGKTTIGVELEILRLFGLVKLEWNVECVEYHVDFPVLAKHVS